MSSIIRNVVVSIFLSAASVPCAQAEDLVIEGQYILTAPGASAGARLRYMDRFEGAIGNDILSGDRPQNPQVFLLAADEQAKEVGVGAEDLAPSDVGLAQQNRRECLLARNLRREHLRGEIPEDKDSILLAKTIAPDECEPNRVAQADATPNDPEYAKTWGLDGGTPSYSVKARQAWDINTNALGTPRQIVAVVDTGIDYNHPDLAANIWTNPGEIPGDGIDNDGNGYVDDIHGYDFVNNDGDPMDDNMHGTHCAGTIGAVGNNGIGVAGVAWRAQIMGLKFLANNGSGSYYNAHRAFVYMLDLYRTTGARVQVSSNSWGGGGGSPVLASDIAALGSQLNQMVIAAAGNNNSNNDAVSTYPANYGIEGAQNVIAVAATDSSGNRASFSNYGANSVHIGAPGVNIYSTLPNGNYGYLSGTSMATPHVSGAMILAMNTSGRIITVGEARSMLLDSAQVNTSLNGLVQGARFLNLLNMMTRARLISGPPTPAPTPTATPTPAPADLSVRLGTTDSLGNFVALSSAVVSVFINNTFFKNLRSDANGYILLPMVTRGAQVRFEAKAPGFTFQTVTVTHSGAAQTITGSVARFTVAGKVIDGQGNPIAGAVVTDVAKSLIATTGADGSFSLTGYPFGSTCELIARIPGTTRQVQPDSLQVLGDIVRRLVIE